MSVLPTVGPPAGVTRRTRRRPVGEPPPLPHEFSRSVRILMIVAAGWVMLWFAGFLFVEDVGIWFNEREGTVVRWVADHRVGWLTTFFDAVHAAGFSWAVPIVGWASMALLIVARRFRHLLVYFGSLVATSYVVFTVAPNLIRSRPWGVEQLAAWEGFAHPSLPVAQLTAVLVGAAYGLVPGKRNRVRAGVVIVVAAGLFGISRVYLGVEYPTDAIVGLIVGASVTSAAFLLVCPEQAFPVGFQRGRTAHLDLGGSRARAIRRALSDQLGIDAVDVQPIGLAESAGSTPMLITVADETPLFGKLYASSHLRSDRWYKLGRELLYGRLEDESRFQTVRRLVEREDYLLRVMRDAGIRVPEPHGIAVITPEREYLIVTEFLDGAAEITDAEIDDHLIDDGLTLVRRLWDDGLAHRDLKPANLMIRDGQVYVIDVAFGQIRPSPWREAVDLANMMLALALRTSAEQVYRRALVLFSPEEIAEAFAASRGVTMPSQLRRELKRDGRDLEAAFRTLAPSRRRFAVQRWTLRRLGLASWVAALIAAGLVFGVGNLQGIGLL